VDHRLVRDGHLDRMSLKAAALYLFLVAVGDGQGLSYYSDDSVHLRLGLSHEDLLNARAELALLDLIAYEKPLYQVLEIAPSGVLPSPSVSVDSDAESKPFPQAARMTPEAAPVQVREIFKKIMEGLP